MVQSPDPAARCWRCGSPNITRRVCEACGTVQPGGAPPACRTPGCLRAPKPEYAYCPDCTDRLLSRALAPHARRRYDPLVPPLDPDSEDRLLAAGRAS